MSSIIHFVLALPLLCISIVASNNRKGIRALYRAVISYWNRISMVLPQLWCWWRLCSWLRWIIWSLIRLPHKVLNSRIRRHDERWFSILLPWMSYVQLSLFRINWHSSTYQSITFRDPHYRYCALKRTVWGNWIIQRSEHWFLVKRNFYCL